MGTCGFRLRKARRPYNITATTKRNDNMGSGDGIFVIFDTGLEVKVFDAGSDTDKVVLSARAARDGQGKCDWYECGRVPSWLVNFRVE